jgi:putative peptidoglycan lipid II flippase
LESLQQGESRRSARVTVLVMVCTALSRLLGFVRIAVIGAVFGASGVADVWNAVFTVPNNLRKLMAEGALSSAFIPALSASLVRDPNRHESRDLAARVLTLQMVILIPLTVLCVVFSRQAVGLLFSFDDPGKMDLSASLFGWVFAYIVLISLSAVLMAVLNSHSVFVLPALTPILFSITVIGATLLFYRQMGIYSMVVGVGIGGLAQVIVQLPRYFSLGYRLKPDLGFRDPGFVSVLKAWVPVLASASIFAATEQIAVLFASGLEDGSTSALSYALVFFQLPFGIFSISIITVLFPRMSRQAAVGDLQGLSGSVSYGLRFTMILLVPAALLFLLLGRQIIAVSLERYRFTSQATLATYRVLAAYSLGLFSLGGFTFLQRFFYASRNYLTPLAVALVVSATDIAFSLWLKQTSLRVTGLAYANTIAFSVGLIVLLVAARRRLGTLNGPLVLRTTLRTVASMVPFVGFLLLYLRLTRSWWTPGSTLANLVVLLGALLGSVAIVLLMYWLLRVEMVRDFLKRRAS